MTRYEAVERKALETMRAAKRCKHASDFSCYECDKARIAALSRAGLLRTEEMQRVMERLTPRVLEYMKEPAGLLGLRIGVSHDFPCRLEHVTPLHERALELWAQYVDQWERPNPNHEDVSYTLGLGRVLGREALALEKPKERWTVREEGPLTCWLLDRDTGNQWLGPGFSPAVCRAAAAQKNAEDRDREAGR